MLTILNIISFDLAFGHVYFSHIVAEGAVRKLFIHVLTVTHSLEVIEKNEIKETDSLKHLRIIYKSLNNTYYFHI